MQENENGKPKISVTWVSSYEQKAVTDAVRRHFDLLSLKDKLRPDIKVLLKPNLLMKRRPEEVTTTHPALIAGLAVCLHELGITDITLADSPGGPYTRVMLKSIYDTSGMTAVAEQYGIKLNFDLESYEVKTQSFEAASEFTLIAPLKNADFIIDVAKLKTHAMTTLSGGVKNLFGTIPGLIKPQLHWKYPEREYFCQMLVDLCETVKPDLTFVDAIVSMEGNGPSGGSPKNTGMILAGFSPYAVDLALCEIAGLDKNEVYTVKHSIKRGLCPQAVSELEFLGDEMKIFKDYKKPDSKSILFNKGIITTRPAIIREKCIGCGKCAESCPAGVIAIADKKASISYKNCIKCFCCHEMCPVKAIKISRRLFGL